MIWGLNYLKIVQDKCFFAVVERTSFFEAAAAEGLNYVVVDKKKRWNQCGQK